MLDCKEKSDSNNCLSLFFSTITMENQSEYLHEQPLEDVRTDDVQSILFVPSPITSREAQTTVAVTTPCKGALHTSSIHGSKDFGPVPPASTLCDLDESKQGSKTNTQESSYKLPNYNQKAISSKCKSPDLHKLLDSSILSSCSTSSINSSTKPKSSLKRHSVNLVTNQFDLGFQYNDVVKPCAYIKLPWSNTLYTPLVPSEMTTTTSLTPKDKNPLFTKQQQHTSTTTTTNVSQLPMIITRLIQRMIVERVCLGAQEKAYSAGFQWIHVIRAIMPDIVTLPHQNSKPWKLDTLWDLSEESAPLTEDKILQSLKDFSSLDALRFPSTCPNVGLWCRGTHTTTTEKKKNVYTYFQKLSNGTNTSWFEPPKNLSKISSTINEEKENSNNDDDDKQQQDEVMTLRSPKIHQSISNSGYRLNTKPNIFTKHSKESNKDTHKMIYFRIQFQDLPFCENSFAQDWLKHFKSVHTLSSLQHLTVVYDLRYNYTSSTHNTWHLSCMKRLVHLTGLTATIIGWMHNNYSPNRIDNSKLAVQILFLTPPSFDKLLRLAENKRRQTLTTGLFTLGHHEKPLEQWFGNQDFMGALYQVPKMLRYHGCCSYIEEKWTPESSLSYNLEDQQEQHYDENKNRKSLSLAHILHPYTTLNNPENSQLDSTTKKSELKSFSSMDESKLCSIITLEQQKHRRQLSFTSKLSEMGHSSVLQNIPKLCTEQLEKKDDNNNNITPSDTITFNPHTKTTSVSDAVPIDLNDNLLKPPGDTTIPSLGDSYMNNNCSSSIDDPIVEPDNIDTENQTKEDCFNYRMNLSLNSNINYEKMFCSSGCFSSDYYTSKFRKITPHIIHNNGDKASDTVVSADEEEGNENTGDEHDEESSL